MGFQGHRKAKHISGVLQQQQKKTSQYTLKLTMKLNNGLPKYVLLAY